MTVTVPPGFGSAFWEFSSVAGTPIYGFTLGLDLSEVGGSYVDAANQLFNAFTTAFGANLDEDITLNRVVLTVGQDGGENGSVQSTVSPYSGDRSGSSEVIALSLLVNKQTATFGRKGRGRMNLVGILADSDLDLSGLMPTSRRTAYQAMLEDFLTYMVDGSPPLPEPVFSMAPVLLHSAPEDAPSPLLGATVSLKAGVLRKRLR